jgi:hypothetical protein
MVEITMISDDDIDLLPEDPEAAFVQYEAILRNAVREANSDRNYTGWDIEREYVAHVLAFVDTRTLPVDLPRNPPSDNEAFYEWYQSFIRAIDYYKAAARLQISARKKQNVSVLVLSPDLKAQIGAHLIAIRKIVSESEISENKRDALFRRINNLQEEVDRDRTRTEAAMALLLDVTSAVAKGAKQLDPVLDRVERIIKVLAKAKDENDQKILMAPQERKRIAPPTTPQGRHGTDSSSNLDDEIPF